MTEATLVSVIIPCYNGGRYVGEAVQSVLDQTHAAVEIIVVDDGSTDNSPEILASFGEKIRVIWQENRGLPVARNVGMQASRGIYLAFLDADDYWDNTFVEKMSSALDDSDEGIAYCGWQNIGLKGGRGEPYVPPDYEHEPSKLELLIENPRWPVHAAMLRRGVIETVGGFDEKWDSCEDFALWIEIATCNPLIRVQEVLAYYRHHGKGQMTGKRHIIARNHWLVQREFLHRHPEAVSKIGVERVREIVNGGLLLRGYACYWDRDLVAARAIFRLAFKHGYLRREDWKYALPCFLPIALQRAVIGMFDRDGSASGL